MNSEKFLVDTTIWIKYLRGLDPSLKERISSLALEDRIFTSEIIILEILRGAESDKEYDMLYEDLLALPQVPVTYEVWETAWKISYKLKKEGLNIPIADILISSIALYYKLTLIHSDKHFSLTATHTGFTTEML